MKKIFLTSFFISNLLANESLDNLSLDELMNIKVYSATKDYRSIEEIPANITIITRKDIEKYNYKTLDELIKNVPGLFVFDDTENFQIGSRGSVGSSFQLMLNNNPIFSQRYPLDLSTNRNFFSIPVKSIDRIEIVKGPQAVTYGANSMYGSINVITNDFNEEKVISFSAGNNNQKTFFNRISHPYENGGFTLNSSFYNTDGINNPETQYSRTQILDDKLESRYKTLDFSNRYKNLTTDIFYSDGYSDMAFLIRRDEFRSNEHLKGISLTYEDDLSDKLSYKINYLKVNKKEEVKDENDYTNPLLDENFKSNHNKDKIDTHLNYSINENIKVLLGTTYENQSYSFHRNVQGIYPRQRNYDNVETKDLYSKINYKINEHFEINAGGRKSLIEKYNLYYYENSTVDNYDYFLERGNKNSVLPEFSAIYHINSANHLKFLYGKANQLQKSSSSIYEDILSKEINYLFLSKKYQINSSVFVNNANNITIDDYQSVSGTSNLQTKGLEFNLTYMPTYNFKTSSGFTYQQTQNLENKEFAISVSPNLLANVSASYIYEDTTYTIWANFVESMKSQRDDNGNFYGKDTNDNITVNTNVNHKLNKQTSLNLNVTNILDRENKAPSSGIIYKFKNGFYTPERSFLLSLDYKF